MLQKCTWEQGASVPLAHASARPTLMQAAAAAERRVGQPRPSIHTLSSTSKPAMSTRTRRVARAKPKAAAVPRAPPPGLGSLPEPALRSIADQLAKQAAASVLWDKKDLLR